MSGSGARFFASSSKPVDPQRRLAAARLGRMSLHADDVAEVDVDLLGDQLDPAAPVDEVEERDLPHLAPRHHAAGEAELLRLVLGARLERLGLGADRSDLVPVGDSASADMRASLDGVSPRSASRPAGRAGTLSR